LKTQHKEGRKAIQELNYKDQILNENIADEIILLDCCKAQA